MIFGRASMANHKVIVQYQNSEEGKEGLGFMHNKDLRKRD